MKHMGGREYSLWDEHDGFFYDVLRYPDGSSRSSASVRWSASFRFMQ